MTASHSNPKSIGCSTAKKRLENTWLF